MESKIMHQTDWLMTEITKFADTEKDYDLDDDLQMTIGGCGTGSRSYTKMFFHR